MNASGITEQCLHKTKAFSTSYTSPPAGWLGMHKENGIGGMAINSLSRKEHTRIIKVQFLPWRRTGTRSWEETQPEQLPQVTRGIFHTTWLHVEPVRAG